MPNAIYPKAKEQFLQAGLNLLTVTVRAVIVDTASYTYNEAHEFLSSVTGIVSTSSILGSKGVLQGTFSGAAVTFTAVTGATAEAVVLYADSGSAATSRLIAYIDTGVTGLPVTPNGNDITLAFETGTSRIFTL